tara:strand:- start:189 stop:479 length:291 start_codon:yes stop_codon:yes gene_type:complete
LELAHAEIESLKYDVDDLTSQLNEANQAYHVLRREKDRRESTLEDINNLAELKRKLEEPTQEEIQSKIDDTLELVSTHDAIKHLEQQLKDDGHETL